VPRPRNKPYRAFRRIDRKLIPRAIAFCATAPGVRRSFLAAWGPESLSFANVRKFFTSSFDHATNTRRFAFAINVSFFKAAHHTGAARCILSTSADSNPQGSDSMKMTSLQFGDNGASFPTSQNLGMRTIARTESDLPGLKIGGYALAVGRRRF
jgi:hypothetical protein